MEDTKSTRRVRRMNIPDHLVGLMFDRIEDVLNPARWVDDGSEPDFATVERAARLLTKAVQINQSDDLALAKIKASMINPVDDAPQALPSVSKQQLESWYSQAMLEGDAKVPLNLPMPAEVVENSISMEDLL